MEFSFGRPDWASANPPDAGTLEVVRAGVRIVADPPGLLASI